MEISREAKMVAGIVLITVPTIEYGGIFLLGMLRHGDTAYVGAVLLGISVLTLGIGLLRANRG